MFEELAKIWYFVKRDMISQRTYKMGLSLMFLNALFGALLYAYLGQNATVQSVVEAYGMSFLTYIVIGQAFNNYVARSLNLVQRTINPWVLEEALVAPMRLSTFILGNSMWSFFWSSVVVATYMTVGIVAFNLTLAINIPATLLVVLLGLGAFFGLSMMGAGVLIITKQGDPIVWFVSVLTNLFGNILFPPQVLPYHLQMISYFLPQYYFFTCIRLVMTGWVITEILTEISILAAMCGILLPLGYFVFSRCIRKAKRDGTLGWF